MYVKKDRQQEFIKSLSEDSDPENILKTRKERRKEKKQQIKATKLKEATSKPSELEESFEAKKVLAIKETPSKKKNLKQQEQIVDNFQELTKKY